jgi:hypothetical protein
MQELLKGCVHALLLEPGAAQAGGSADSVQLKGDFDPLPSRG